MISFLSLYATFKVLEENVSEAIADWCTYIYKTNIQLFGSVSSLEIAPGIHIIVPYDPCDDIRCRDTFGSLCWYKHS